MQGFSTSWGRESIVDAFSLKPPSEFCIPPNKSFVLALGSIFPNNPEAESPEILFSFKN
jgi:hypothetical protein